MSISLQEFVRKTIEEINAGIPKGYVIEETIDFEVSVTTSTNKTGGIEIKVLSGSIEKENQIVQTVLFSVINKVDKKRSEKNAGDAVIKLIDKGLRKLAKYSEDQKQKQLSTSEDK